jgi:hypothetical protein
MLVTSKAKSGAFLVLALVVAAVGVGCGSSNSSNGVSLGPNSNNSLLNGQYAFLFSGEYATSSVSIAFVTAAGSFTADGNGHITSGQEDFTVAGVGTTNFTFGGTYAVGSDNRGNALLTGTPGCATWQFTLVNGSHGVMTCFGPLGDLVITANGNFDLQDTTAFSTTKLTGDYVFNFAGQGLGLGNVAQAGDLQMNGAGSVPGGEVDINDSLSVTQDGALTGTYTVASSGRGTAALNFGGSTHTYAFYVVNAGDMKFVETDTLPVAGGEMRTQAAAPVTLASGGYAFTFAGADSAGLSMVAGGVMTTDGNGTLSGGTLDVNDNGTVQTPQTITGTYSFNTTGRGTTTIGGRQFAIYPAQDGTVNMAEIDTFGVTAGTAQAQSGSFSAGSITGNYALAMTGSFLPAPSTPQEEDITGRITSDGVSGLSGTLDINNFGAFTQGLAVSSGSYTMSSNGRGTATINTSNATLTLQTYQVNSNTVFLIDLDPFRVMTGILQK